MPTLEELNRRLSGQTTEEPSSVGELRPLAELNKRYAPAPAPAPAAPTPEPVSAPKELYKGLMRGGIGLYGSIAGTLPRMLGEVYGAETLAKFGQFEQAWAAAEKEKYKKHPELRASIWETKGGVFVKQPAAWLAANVGEIMPSFAASVVPGVGAHRLATIAGWGSKAIKFATALAAGVGGGSLEGLALYDELRDKGYSPDDAAARGALMLIGSGLLNAYQVGKLVTPGVRSRMVHLIKSGAVEGWTEWAEEPLAGALSGELAAGSRQMFVERMKNSLDVLLAAGVTGGIGGAAVSRVEAPAKPSPGTAKEIAEEAEAAGYVGPKITVEEVGGAEQADFVDKRVEELGSYEAVREAYPGESAVDRYAKAKAEELFGRGRPVETPSLGQVETEQAAKELVAEPAEGKVEEEGVSEPTPMDDIEAQARKWEEKADALVIELEKLDAEFLEADEETRRKLERKMEKLEKKVDAYTEKANTLRGRPPEVIAREAEEGRRLDEMAKVKEELRATYPYMSDDELEHTAKLRLARTAAPVYPPRQPSEWEIETAKEVQRERFLQELRNLGWSDEEIEGSVFYEPEPIPTPEPAAPEAEAEAVSEEIPGVEIEEEEKGVNIEDTLEPQERAAFDALIESGLVDKDGARRVVSITEKRTGKKKMGLAVGRIIRWARVLEDEEISDRERAVTIGHEGFEVFLNMFGYDHPTVIKGLSILSKYRKMRKGESDAEYATRLKEIFADQVGEAWADKALKSRKHKGLMNWLRIFYNEVRAVIRSARMGVLADVAETMTEALTVEKIANVGAHVKELGSREAVLERYPGDTEVDRFARQRAEELFGPKEMNEDEIDAFLDAYDEEPEFRSPREDMEVLARHLNAAGVGRETAGRILRLANQGKADEAEVLVDRLREGRIDEVFKRRLLLASIRLRQLRGAEVSFRSLRKVEEPTKPQLRDPNAAFELHEDAKSVKEKIHDIWPMIHWLRSPEAIAEALTTRDANTPTEQKVFERYKTVVTGLVEADLKRSMATGLDAERFTEWKAELTQEQQLQVREAAEAIYKKDLDALGKYDEAVQRAAAKVVEYFYWMRAVYRSFLKRMINKHMPKRLVSAYTYMIENGLTPEETAQVYDKVDVAELTELYDRYRAADTWGLDSYLPNFERGQYRLVDETGTTRAVALTVADAKRKGKRLLEDDPDIKLTIESGMKLHDVVSTRVSRGLYWRLVSEFKKAFGDFNASAEDVRAALRGNIAIEPAPKFAGPTMKRKGVLKGEDNIFDVIYAYSYAMHSKVFLDPVLDDARGVLSSLGPNLRKALQQQIDATKGKYWVEDEIFDRLIQAATLTETDKGVIRIIKSLISPAAERSKGAIATRYVAKARMMEGWLKLGYRPVAALINWAGGNAHTWVKTGSTYMRAASAFLRTEEGKAFMERNKWAMGIDLALDVRTDVVKARRVAPLWSPLGLFGYPEPQIRRLGLAANYLYARRKLGMDSDKAEAFARRALRFQNFTYNIAALPHILRSPAGRLVGQFKTYLIKEIEFILSLKRDEWVKYAGMQMVLGGMRGFSVVVKSFPLFYVLFGLADQDPDEWLDKLNLKLGFDVSRGLAGLFGADISVPATVQLPGRLEEWAGPFLADLWKLFSILFRKAEGEEMMGREFAEWGKGLSPIMYYWNQLFDSVMSPDGWVRDEGGRKLYQPTLIDQILYLPSGAAPAEYKKKRLLLQRLNKELEVRRRNRTKAVDRIMRHFLKNEESTEAINNLIAKYSITADMIKRRMKEASLTPGQRLLLRARLLDRPYILEQWQIYGPDEDEL